MFMMLYQCLQRFVFYTTGVHLMVVWNWQGQKVLHSYVGLPYKHTKVDTWYLVVAFQVCLAIEKLVSA